MKKLFIPPVFVFISLSLIIAFYFLIPGFNWIPFPYNFLGVLIAFPGFVIMGKTRDLFDKYKTILGFDKSSHLIIEGIFLKTRNPMYIGMFLFLFGIGVCFMNLFSILTAIIFILAIRICFISKEEKLLYDKFGDVYAAYKNQVRKWI